MVADHLAVFRGGEGPRFSPLPFTGSVWTQQRVQGTQPAPCPPGSLEISHFRLVYCRVLSRCGSCDPIGQTPPFMHLEGSPKSLERVSFDLEATRSSRSKPWTAEEQGSCITGAVAPATPSVAKDGFQSQLPHGCPWGRAGFYCNSGHPSSSCALTPSIQLAAPCPFILMSQGAGLNACSIFQAGLRKTTRPVQDHT